MQLNDSVSLVSPRFLLAAMALVTLSLASAASHGFYSTVGICGALIALTAALAACSRHTAALIRAPAWLGTAALLAAAAILAGSCLTTDWQKVWIALTLAPGLLLLTYRVARRRSLLSSLPLVVTAAAALLLSGKAVVHTRLLASDQTTALYVLRGAAALGFLLIAASVGLDLNADGERGPGSRMRLLLLFAAGAVLRIATVLAWPEPSIDVWIWLRDAPRALLAGNNPYTVEYIPGVFLPTYPPLPILAGVPFSAAGLDVRYANVCGDLVAALVLFGLARRQGQPLLGALTAATFLNLPGVPFMLKHAWFEPMLAALLGGGILLAGRGGWFGGFLLGLGLTGKQFGLPMLLPLWRAWRGTRTRLLLGVFLAIVLVIFPFFLWSPSAFVDVVLYGHLAIGPDVQSLTVRSAAHHLLGVEVPGWLAAGLALLLLGWVAASTPPRKTAVGLWMGTTLLIFCLFYVKGYFNYFYLCNYLFLLGMVGIPSQREGSSPFSVPGERQTAGSVPIALLGCEVPDAAASAAARD